MGDVRTTVGRLAKWVLTTAAAAALLAGSLVGLGGTAVAGAVAPHDSFSTCTFSAGGHSSTTSNPGHPAVLSGVTDNETISLACSGLPPTTPYQGSPTQTTVIAAEASPLAAVSNPANFNTLAPEADVSAIINTLTDSPPAQGALVSGSGTISGLTLQAKSGSSFATGAPADGIAGDPNAACPPTQAQIDAGLGACIISLSNFTAALGSQELLSYATAIVLFAGQGAPSGTPSVGFATAGQAGHPVNLGSGHSATGWWGGGWWAGGSTGSPSHQTFAPQPVPNSNVFVNGAPAPASSVSVRPAVYCFYGGSSAGSCTQSGSGPHGALFPATLQGSVTIPGSAHGTSATVQVYEPNVWPSFPGNSTNSKFPNDVTGSGGVLLASSGYWMLASDGGVFNYGTAQFFGSMGASHLNAPMVGIQATPDGHGYWLVASDGGVFSFGDAHFYGSTGNIHLNEPIVGMASTPNGHGYWLVASDGGVFSFGNARFFGSTGGVRLNRPIVGMASTPSGDGYWLVGSDGGIFNFGNADYEGSAVGLTLNQSIQDISPTADGHGYWLVGSAGGVIPYGDAAFYGSMAGHALNGPVVSLVTTPKENGYWLVGSDGGIFNFGAAPFYGSAGDIHLVQPIIAAAGTPPGES